MSPLSTCTEKITRLAAVVNNLAVQIPLRYINGMPGPEKEFPARLELRMTEDDKADLARLAKQDGVSVGSILRELVRSFIAARTRKRRQPED